MKEKLLEKKLQRQRLSVCPDSGCDGDIYIRKENGWQFFDCEKTSDGKKIDRGIILKDYGADNGERDKKLKNIIKRILCPAYRRSYKISRYIEKGYSHREALAKVNVIQII